ncbi:hypothetical protein [Mesobacillus zeae]|uniref:hypothetical protein n=1 Tax=Mesobacillus zeae TaxID=1917180 RepID=UPI0015E7A862|nr:hypothetical protein [Mesobacillus zeae]
MNREQILKNLRLQIEEIKTWIIDANNRDEHNEVSYHNGRLEALEGIENKINQGFWKID